MLSDNKRWNPKHERVPRKPSYLFYPGVKVICNTRDGIVEGELVKVVGPGYWNVKKEDGTIFRSDVSHMMLP